MNALPGVATYSSCEGTEMCSPDAFVCFRCDDEGSLDLIRQFVGSRAEIGPGHNGGYRLSFPVPENLMHLNRERNSRRKAQADRPRFRRAMPLFR